MGIFDRIAGTLDELVGDNGDTEARARDEIALARGFAERGQYDEAAERLADLARRHPRLAEIPAAQGELAAKRGDDEGAVAAFGRAVDLHFGDAMAWLGLGQALARLGRFEPARDALRRALTQSLPDDARPRAQAALGRLYARAGQWGKAVRDLRKAVEALPDDTETVAAFGQALLATGEAEGTEWLARAARLPGGQQRLLLQAAAGAPDATTALRLLDEAVERAPDDPAARTARARQRLAMGDPAGALADAVAATELGAESQSGKQGRAEQQAKGGSDPDPNFQRLHPPLLRSSVFFPPASPSDDSWRCLGDVRAAGGDFEGAIEAARREAALAPGSPPFGVWLARALGAEDLAAIEEALRHGGAHEAGYDEARALVAGTPTAAQIETLAGLAPSPAARRFVVRRRAPPPLPAGDVVGMLAWAEALAEREPALVSLAVPMARATEAFGRPLLVAVMGEFNAGKSSLVNALAGGDVAPVGVTPTTATINVLRYGPGGGRVSYHDGTTRDLGPASVGPFLRELGDAEAAAIRQVEIFAPVESLRRVEIVDTPGLNSLRPEHEKVARDFLVEADALVWVFAAGQAAKASERAALNLAQAAHKKVLGVVNKIDRVEPDEIEPILRHVRSELGALVEDVVPLSAQAALAARRRGDDAAVSASGFPAFGARLETSFFARARELKRTTATSALQRFLDEARALLPAPLVAADIAVTRGALAAAQARLRSALAAERVTLRARLNEGFRTAATEVRELVRPRAWLFGEHRADAGDETFLADLLDDATARATGATRGALVLALREEGDAPVPADVTAWQDQAVEAIDDAIERFQAYARGIIEGAAAVFFRIELPRIRLDLGAIHAALGRWSPDPEDVLFRKIERAVVQLTGRAEAKLDQQERAREIDALVREENVLDPLASLARALRSDGATRS